MSIWEVKKNKLGLYAISSVNLSFPCQIGSGGLVHENNKIEGDKCTPKGNWHVKNIYYRDDKTNFLDFIFKDFLSFKKITKNCGWCDDPTSNDYNSYIEINKKGKRFPYSFEKLWRRDQAYDIIIETDYNQNPMKIKRGSAIFIHCSFKDYRSTSGCVALSKESLILLVNSIKKETKINIR